MTRLRPVQKPRCVNLLCLWSSIQKSYSARDVKGVRSVVPRNGILGAAGHKTRRHPHGVTHHVSAVKLRVAAASDPQRSPCRTVSWSCAPHCGWLVCARLVKFHANVTSGAAVRPPWHISRQHRKGRALWKRILRRPLGAQRWR
ncbi:hypothetical protein K491DRAFT_14333 [Lophiostoma macrostomum CBS 122681]|uniref:Uncharacterized protein n=1 Tax=Lophiostoma macrostomum CBS 122681 TaxID=1314788 RepID=A0A6A6TV81_9PLEO|nr:hypothetical protein K491DRAFT_14333 [Lophiostoma macrostomum CBS 122681]